MDFKRSKKLLTFKVTACFILATVLSCSNIHAELLADLPPVSHLSSTVGDDSNMLEYINNAFFSPSPKINEEFPTIIRGINDAFAPDQNENNGIFAEKPYPSPSAIQEKNLNNIDEILPELHTVKDLGGEQFFENEQYFAEDFQNVDKEIIYDGKTISNIYIAGLNTLNEDVIFSVLNTKSGSKYNSKTLQKDLQNIYAQGYFTENMTIEPTLSEDDTVELILKLQENIMVSNIAFEGNTVVPSETLRPFTTKMIGKPQNIQKINEAITKINNCYHDKGYILAKVADVTDNSSGLLTFQLNEGIIDNIEIVGNEKTKDYVILRNILTTPGTVYNEDLLKNDLTNVFSTQIFSDVNREIEQNENGGYNLKIVVKEPSSNNISIGGGLDSALGVFGSLGYKDENFLGRAQRLSLSGMVGSGILLSDESVKNRMNYQVELDFFEPYFINSDNSLMGKFYYRDLGSYQVPLAIERRIGLKGGIEHKLKSIDNTSANLTAGFENISLKEGDFKRISSMYSKRGFDIKDRAKELSGGFFFNIEPGLRFNTLDELENPRNGVIANIKYAEALCVNDFDRTNGRLVGGVTKYFPVREKSSFSLTTRAGVKVHGNDMPEVMAFRLGGPYSIRGYRINGVGMGEGFLMGSAELNVPLPFSDRVKYDFFKKMRIAFFLDAGRVFDETIGSALYDRPLSALSAGVGLKAYIPGIGPLSVDYGIPLVNVGHYGSKRGYFTFGSGGMNGW